MSAGPQSTKERLAENRLVSALTIANELDLPQLGCQCIQQIEASKVRVLFSTKRSHCQSVG